MMGMVLSFQIHTHLSSVFQARIIEVSRLFRAPSYTVSLFFYLCKKQSAENHRRPDYMGGQALRSPEALLGAQCGTNTDMWALGCVVGNALHWENGFN